MKWKKITKTQFVDLATGEITHQLPQGDWIIKNKERQIKHRHVKYIDNEGHNIRYKLTISETTIYVRRNDFKQQTLF